MQGAVMMVSVSSTTNRYAMLVVRSDEMEFRYVLSVSRSNPKSPRK